MWQWHLSAQERCGFEAVHSRNLRNSESYRKNIEAQEKFNESFRRNTPQTEQVLQPNQALAVNAALYTIPVVVHVLHTGGAVGTIYNPSDADIQGAIDHLNQVYNGSYPGMQGAGDIQIQFALAQRDVNCNPTSGIVRVNGSSVANYTTNGVNVSATTGASEISVKNISRWDPSKYYNIWMVNRIDGNDGTSGSYIAGFAYLPGASGTLDGTIILSSVMKAGRKTLPHEIGHAFNLYHVFEGSSGSCVANTNCSTQGDLVCDTDPVTSTSTCRTGTNTCNSLPYSINTENNFMAYTACFTLFTQGQKDRMLAAAAGPFRLGLSSTYALASIYPVTPYAAPASTSCTPVTSATGMGGYFAGVMQLELAGRTIMSTTPANEGGYKNNGTDCHALILLQQGSTYSIDVTLYGVNAEQMKGWIDFNNNGVFDNATEQIISFEESSVPGGRSGVKVTGSFAVPADAVLNTVLKLRIIDDIATVYGTMPIGSACHNSVYGQGEDYPVLIQASFLLPVQLTEFKGIQNGPENLLYWETASELNTDRFVIQRSFDGTRFTDIGSENARGSENKKTSYRFVDKQIASGTYYYRLMQVDKDGRFTYSTLVKLQANAKRPAGLRIVNNPAVSHLDIEFPITQTVSTLRVIDVTGKTFLQITIPKGLQRYRIDEVVRLRPGLYILEFQSVNREVIRFVKQ